MAQKNKKTSGSKINARWINNAMKSIGQASLSTFKDFAPTITDTASAVGKDLKSLRNIAKNTTGQNALAENKYIQVAKKSVGYAIEDLKNGKFWNADREDDLMAKSMGLDDFDFDFDDSDDGGDVTFNYIDESDNGASSDAAFQISNTITESTNASLKASKATIDAMVSIAGTSLQQSQQIGSEVISYLGNIDNTLTSILEYQQENTTKFYEASLAFMEKMGPGEEDGSYQDDKIKSSDLMGSGGKLDIGKYKKYVQQQMKSVMSGSEAGTLASMLSDPNMLEMMTANPVGAATKFIIGGITPKLVKGTIENVEEAFKDFMPTMLSRLNKWKDDASLGWIGTLKRTIGQVFGIDLENNASFDLGGKVTKDAAVFDGVTRNAIVEVIPKYLRESTSYLKSIAEHFNVDTKNAIGNSDVYSVDENRYVKQKDLRKNIGQRLDSAATGDYGLSQFGKTLQKGGYALEGHDSKAYDRMVNQLFGFITRNNKNLSPEDIDLSDKNSEFSKMLDKVDVGRKDKKAFNVLSETLKLMKENNRGTGDLASAQIKAKGSLKSAVDDMSANFDMENLLAAGIDDDTNIYELMDEAVGNKRNIALRAKALNKAKKTEKKNEKESDASFSEGYSRRSAKDLAAEGFNTKTQKEKDRDAQLANASPDSIMGTFATTGNHLRNGMYAAMNGDSKGFVAEMGKIFTDSLGGLWDSFHKSFIKPAVSALFGEKDENGYVQGGIVGGAQNKIKDTWGALNLRLTGKAYKDSQGETHTTESEGIKSSAQIIKDTMKKVGDSIRFRLFGADDEEGEDGKDKKKGIVNNLVTTMKAGIAGWKAALFGETDEDVEKSVADIKKKAMDAIPDAGAGAIGGALVGGVAGSSLLGTLIGGPVGGAIVGMGLSFARKSTAFQDYVFGPKVEDADGNVSRVGGLISKATQDMFKDPKTKKSMVGGAALGIAKNVVLGSSGGLLGTLVGGPLAGAVIGAGFSLFKRSEMFQKFLYGDEKTGKTGLIKHFQNAIGKKREKTDEEEASAAKKLGMTIIGAGGGAITAALVGKVGLLGAMLTPGGPIGGAILGGAIGIAGGMSKFKKMLFGEKDEESGKRKGGLMQKFGNFMHVEVMQPMKDLFLDIGEDLKTTIQYKVLDVIRTSVEPITGAMKGFVDNLKKKATGVISDVGNEVKTNLIKPFLTIVSNVFAPVRKAGEIIAKAATKAAKSIITFPFKIMSSVARLITSPFRKMASAINKHLVKPIIKKATSFVKGLFGGVGKLLNIGAAATNAVRYGVRTKLAGVGKEGKNREYTDDGTFRSESRRSKKEYRQEMKENRKKRVERRNLDANRRQMAKLLGYDAKYFTEENYQKAMDAARAQKKKVAWAGGKKMTFDKDPEQVAKEARAKAEQEKADRLKGKGNAELLNADTKDADVDMRLLVEDVKQTGLLERIVSALTGESPFGGILDKNGTSGKKESEKSDAEKKEDSLASLEEEYKAKREESEDTIDKLTNEMIQSGGVGKWLGGKFKTAVDKIPGIDKAKNAVNSIEEGMGHAKNAAKEGFEKLKDRFSRKGKARAKGGPVEKGKATLVGDGGKDPSAMEIMVPKSNGKVLAQGKDGLRVFIAGVAKKAAETFGKANVDEAKKSNVGEKVKSATLNTASGYFDAATNSWVSSDKHQSQIEKSIARHQKKVEKQNKAKATLEETKKSGSFINKRAQKAAADKETQQAATLGEIAKNTKESATTGKKSLFEWLKIFGKGGLIVAALIKFWPIIKKVFSTFGKVGLESIIQTINDIKDGIANIGNPLATLVEKVNAIADVFAHPGDIIANLKQLLLGDDEEEGGGDAATVDRLNVVRKKGTKAARKAKKHIKSVKKTVNKIKDGYKSVKDTVKGGKKAGEDAVENVAKDGTEATVETAGKEAAEEGAENAGKNVAKEGGEATLDTASKNTERMIKENEKIISEKSTGYLDDSGKWVTSSKQEEQMKKSIARHNKKTASKGAATLETKAGKEASEQGVKNAGKEAAEQGLKNGAGATVETAGKEAAENAGKNAGKTAAKDVGKKGLKSAIADGAKSLKDRFISMVTEGINGIVKKIAEKFAAKNGGKGAKLLTHAKALTNLLKTAKNWISKKFATISVKVSALFASDTALGAATAGIGLVLKKAGFAIAGGLSEMSNPRRLFRLDPKEKPDWIMRLIAAGVGAFRGGLLIGACVDIADALLMEFVDTSIYTEIATFTYRLICEQTGETSKADKLVQKQTEFENKYKKEREVSQKKQYQAYLTAHGQTEKDYSYDQFKTEVANKTKSSGMDSFSDYTADKNKTIGAKMGDATMRVLNPVGKAIWGSSETGYYDPKTHIFYRKTDKAGQFMMVRCNKVDKDGNPVGDLKELGVIAEENMPDKKSLIEYTKEKKGLRDVVKFGANAIKNGAKALKTSVKETTKNVQNAWKNVKKGNLLGAGKNLWDAAKSSVYGMAVKGTVNVVKNGAKAAANAVHGYFVGNKETIYRNPKTKTYWKQEKKGKYCEYNVNGERMSPEEIDDKTLKQMLQDGTVVKDTIKNESGLSKTVKTVKKNLGNFAKNVGNGLKTAGGWVAKGAKTVAKTYLNGVKTTYKNMKSFFFAEKETIFRNPSTKTYWKEEKDGKWCEYNVQNEKMSDKSITREQIQQMLQNGVVVKDKLTTKESGLTKTIGAVKKGLGKFVNAVGKGLKSAGSGLKSAGKWITNKFSGAVKAGKKFISDTADKAKKWFDDKTSAYRDATGKGYWDYKGRYYTENGERVEAKDITTDELKERLENGTLIKTKLGPIKLLGKLGHGIASKAGKVFKNGLNAVKKGIGNVGKWIGGAFKSAGKALSGVAKKIGGAANKAKKWFTDKTIAYRDNTGKGYWDYKGRFYTENGERVEAKDITTDELKERLESGTLTKTKLSGVKTLQKMGKDALAGIKNGLGKGYKALKGGVKSFAKGVKNVFNSAKDGLKSFTKGAGKLIGNALNWLDSGTKRDVYGYYTPDGKGYYTMNDDGTFNKYSMAGDLMEEKIGGDDAKLIADLIARGVYKKDKVDETSDLKESVKAIKDKVSEGWKNAKDTVAGAWDKFTNWISGSGSEVEMPSVDGGSGDSTPVGQGATTDNTNNSNATVGGNGTANNYPYYSQKDPKWAKMSYSSGENKGTMGDAGCGPTAMAMVATKYKGSTDPTRIAEDAKNAGYRDSTGTNANFMNYESKKLGISSKETNKPTAEYISSNVGNGKSMILNGISMGEKESAFTNAGHYVVAVGKDKDGNILINDPRGKEYSRAIPPEELASESRVGWTFNRGKAGGKGVSKVGKFFTNMKNKAIKKIIGGRGQDWIGCVRSVHKAMSAAGRKNNYQYNKSGICHTIKVGGKEYSVRWDCSGYVSACLQVYGVKKKGWTTDSGGFASKNCNIDKFKWMSWPGWDKLQEGDIMARNGHVEIFAYNKDGAHYVYNAGSTDAINATKPTHTGHKNGYTAIWRPDDPGQGVELQTDTVSGDSSSSSDASVDSSSSSSSDSSSDVLSQITDVFSQYSTKAMNGLLKGQWDYNFNSNSDTSSSSSDSSSGTDASNEVSGDIKVTGNNNVEKVWNFFTGKGFSPAATAGILGNMYQESGVNPASIQGNGKGPAAGIFQWENYNTKTSRFGNLYKRAQKAGKSWKDLGVQLDYALAEMKDDDISQRFAGKFGIIKKGGTNVTDIDGKKYVINPVDGFEGYKKMTDESEAVKTFEGAFERAGKPNFKRRINYAKSVMKKYGNTGGNGEGDPEVSIQKTNPTHVESFNSSTEMLRTKEIKNKVDTAFDTSRMEEILTKVYDVLLSIDGNTEGMRKAVKGLGSTTVNTQNIITSSGSRTSKTSTKTQKSERTTSGGSQTNANLAEQIARG